MANEIVFVGAGPIGLWTAIQIKLQRPEINIVFKEKHESYQRFHTLFLKDSSFANCMLDDQGTIQGIIDQLQNNPNIRTNVLESSLLELAKQLGITLDYQNVVNVENDILHDYPDAAMVIGADGVRSTVGRQIFGEDNIERTPLAYAAQIKYTVKGEALRENQLLQTYPLWKHANYLAFVNVGRTQDGHTPVTVQYIIDQDSYEKIRAKTTFNRPIKLFADDIDEQLPAPLLSDIKSHLGFRLANDEDILVDSVNLTTTELPQQRCKKTILFSNGRYYGLIGDAALALSYFKGMNSGLQLATQFAIDIASNWDDILARNPNALNTYEQHYNSFADRALSNGHKTNKSIRLLRSTVQSGSILPFQIFYFENNDIADFQRHFDILQQTSQFYLETSSADEEHSALMVKEWLATQMPEGLPLLKLKLLNVAADYQDPPELFRVLLRLATIEHDSLNFHEQAYLGLAISKTCALLESPTQKMHEKYAKFALKIKAVNSDFSLIISSILKVIVGVAAIIVGATSLAASASSALPLAMVTVGAGALLAGNGFYKLQKCLHPHSETYQAVTAIASATPIDEEEERVQSGLDALA